MLSKITHISGRIVWLLAISVIVSRCKTSDPEPRSELADTYDAEVAMLWVNLSLDLVKNTPGFTPPVASRALGYAGLTLYEAVVHGLPANRSMEGQLYNLTSLPKPDSRKRYNWALVANAAEAEMVRRLFVTTPESANRNRIDSLEGVLRTRVGTGQAAEVISDSEAYGKSVAMAIWEWSKTDGGHEGYRRNFPTDYKAPIFPGSWRPTENGLSAMQPYWGNNRLFVTHNTLILPPRPLPLSVNPSSPYYQQNLKVYQKNKALTQAEKEIAIWWADDPSETFTPPGHSMYIATIAVKNSEAKLGKAAETFARVGLAVSDAFVICWKCKYAFSIERPYTFVRRAIDRNWVPFWPAPPFPSFTSGHATQSAAVATVLTDLYGASFAFTDDAHANRPKDALRNVEFKPRTFTSFQAFAEESAHSRFLGGIHTDQDNEEGLAKGRIVGRNVNALRWK